MPIRIGDRVGPRIGYGIGQFGNRGFIGQGNPNNLAVITLQSNSGGAYALAANMTDFPAVTGTFSNVKIMRRGAAPAGLPPTWVTEGPEDLQPRVTQIDPVSYPVGGGGVELQLGRTLDSYGPSTKWRLFIIFMDGSGLENHWMTSTGKSMWIQYVADACTQMNAHVELVIPIGGEADGGESPDFLDFDANLENFFISTMQPLFGNFKMCVPTLSWHSGAGQTNVISAVTSFAARHGSLVKWVNTNDLGFRVADGVHYAEDAAGKKGYCTLGARIGDGWNALNTAAWPPTTKPYVKSFGAVVTGSSAQGVSPVPPSHAAGDRLLLIHASNGQTAYTAPSGWASVTNSPQHDAASGVNARLSVFERVATDSATATPTVADVAGDGGKMAVIVNIGQQTGTLVTAGATAAASAAVSFPSVDTTGTNNCLILNVLACTLTTAGAKMSGWTNAALAELEQVIDFFSASSSSGMCLVTGIKATGGVIGNTTATLSAATGTQAMLTIAIKP